MTDTIAPPTAAAAGVTPGWEKLKVVDVATGAEIERVVEADSTAGKLRRMAVEDGNLVREGDHFKMIEEDRAIRIEWRDPPAIESAAPAAELA